jgi:hypothetical protein
MANKWYHSKDGKTKVGPISPDELQNLARTGQLSPTDLVWAEGMEKWVVAANFAGLFPALVHRPNGGFLSRFCLPISVLLLLAAIAFATVSLVILEKAERLKADASRDDVKPSEEFQISQIKTGRVDNSKLFSKIESAKDEVESSLKIRQREIDAQVRQTLAHR